jgi:hypothetical protein
MSYLTAGLSAALIGWMLVDAFEAMLLPRRIARHFRFARLFYVYSWAPWAFLAQRMRPGKWRNAFLSFFGPLSVLLLICAWATGLIFGFALLQWSLGSALRSPDGETVFAGYLYFSGVTFFTLGFGDLTPIGPFGRFLTVVEGGIGFAFLAVVISYLPVLYQAFSRREVTISLLDARAGSPPTAAQVLIRLGRHNRLATLDRFLEEWERWAAEVLESHISFPVLSYYRSQHDNQSWLAALTAILDTATIVMAAAKNVDPYQAELTFATARHTVVDLAQVYFVPPVEPETPRLTPDQLARLRAELKSAGLELREAEQDAVARKVAELRGMYEPFITALGRYLLLALPPVISDSTPVDNWQTSAWMRRTTGIGSLALPEPGDDHRD